MIGAGVGTLAEVAQAIAQRLPEVAKPARAKNDQHDRQDQDQVAWLKSAHE